MNVTKIDVNISRANRLIVESIQLSPIATVVSDPRQDGNPLIAANQAFCDLTGYSQSEILGRNCKFLAGPRTENWQTEKIRESIQKSQPILVELLNYKKDGTPFRNAVMIAPVFDDAGVVEYFYGSQVALDTESDSVSLNRQRSAAELVGQLSPRQKQILQMMATGARTKQIAFDLSLSEKTVQMHRMLLFKKLATSSISDAIRIAVEAGL